MHTLSHKALHELDRLMIMGINLSHDTAHELYINFMVIGDWNLGKPHMYPTVRGIEVWKEYPQCNLTIFPCVIKWRWDWLKDVEEQMRAQYEYIAQEFMEVE